MSNTVNDKFVNHFVIGNSICALAFLYLLQVLRIYYSSRARGGRNGVFRLPLAAYTVTIKGRLVALDGMGKILLGLFCLAWAFRNNPPMSDSPINGMLLLHFLLYSYTISIGVADCLVAHRLAPRKLDFYWHWAGAYLFALILYLHYPSSHDDPCGQHFHVTNSTGQNDVMHSHGQRASGSEVLAHKFIALVAFSLGNCSMAEIYADLRVVVLPIIRCALLFTMGIWVVMTSFLLYPPRPSWRLIDPTTTEGMIITVSFFTLAVAKAIWIVMGIAAIMNRNERGPSSSDYKICRTYDTDASNEEEDTEPLKQEL